MRISVPFLSAMAAVSLLAAGCAGPEKKAGRGVNNLFEVVRGGDLRRSVEQSAVFENPDTGYTTGLIRGFNRSLTRTVLGAYEIVTAPLPPYDPVLTGYLSPNPVYPDNYKPRVIADSNFATDTYLGFAGGDVAPMIPGSRFRIFDN